MLGTGVLGMSQVHAESAVREKVVHLYCQSGQQALSSDEDFSTAAQFRSFAAAIQGNVCNKRSTPYAEATFNGFGQRNVPRILSQAPVLRWYCAP
jgi:hypothetical protein